MLKPEGIQEAADLYLAGADPRHPYASPLYADFRDLPPLLIHVGDAEMLLDDSTRLAAKATDAGTEVSLETWDEMPHVFPAFAGLLPEADKAIEHIGAWLDRHYPSAR
jgi:acetyl esterase/lipase